MDKRVQGFITILVLCGIFFCAHATHKVKFETTSGDFIVELDSVKAPVTVANFLKYVRSSFYNGTIFHRVIDGFVIQGGGLTADMTEKDTDPPIPNEAYNGLKNIPGSIAMAREDEPHTATSQFYINTVNNAFLNYVDSTSNIRWGYCVFGVVIEGMEVVRTIEKVETETVGDYEDVPIDPIIVNNAEELTTGMPVSEVKVTPSSSIIKQTGNSVGIDFPETEKEGSFEIFTLQGRKIYSHRGIKSGTNVIPLKKFSSGVFVFGIKIGNDFVEKGNVLIR